MSKLYMSAFRKHIETVYPASYKSTIERFNREHRVYSFDHDSQQELFREPWRSIQAGKIPGRWSLWRHNTLGLTAGSWSSASCYCGMFQLWVTNESESQHHFCSCSHPMNPATYKQVCNWYKYKDWATNCSQLTWTQNITSLNAHCWKNLGFFWKKTDNSYCKG